jgi:hypothetical protein
VTQRRIITCAAHELTDRNEQKPYTEDHGLKLGLALEKQGFDPKFCPASERRHRVRRRVVDHKR